MRMMFRLVYAMNPAFRIISSCSSELPLGLLARHERKGCASCSATLYRRTPIYHTRARESCWLSFNCSGDINPRYSKLIDTHRPSPPTAWLIWDEILIRWRLSSSEAYSCWSGLGVLIIYAILFNEPIRVNSVKIISVSTGLCSRFSSKARFLSRTNYLAAIILTISTALLYSSSDPVWFAR